MRTTIDLPDYLAREAEKSLNARIAEMLKPLRQQPEGGPPSRKQPSSDDPLESR